MSDGKSNLVFMEFTIVGNITSSINYLSYYNFKAISARGG
jgi:hypothetical protein